MTMKTILLALLLAACGDARTSFAGSYDGTWVAIKDPADHGTAHWEFKRDGKVTGTDTEAKGVSRVTGGIDAKGNLVATTSPMDGSQSVSLNGPLHKEGKDRLVGPLRWGAVPPIAYRYSLKKIK
jgi:hypothetical protein